MSQDHTAASAASVTANATSMIRCLGCDSGEFIRVRESCGRIREIVRWDADTHDFEIVQSVSYERTENTTVSVACHACGQELVVEEST